MNPRTPKETKQALYQAHSSISSLCGSMKIRFALRQGRRSQLAISHIP
jgi:hypothetical protein